MKTQGTAESAAPAPTPSGAPVNHTANSASTGNWKPQVHFAWDVVLDVYLGDKQTGGERAGFPEFYRAAVDGELQFS